MQDRHNLHLLKRSTNIMVDLHPSTCLFKLLPIWQNFGSIYWKTYRGANIPVTKMHNLATALLCFMVSMQRNHLQKSKAVIVLRNILIIYLSERSITTILKYKNIYKVLYKYHKIVLDLVLEYSRVNILSITVI